MKKAISVLLAGLLAVAGLGLTTVSSEARHTGTHFGIYFGSPYPYYRHHYRPHRYYYPPPPRRYYPPPRRQHYRGGGNAHVNWCYNRYRSYRAWDNTFQPYNGPRRQCYSPYWR